MADKAPPPSTDRADCPKEACLEFVVVDHWGEDISPPTEYELEGVGPVKPNVPVTCLKKRNYKLRAKDGQELREKMKRKLPYKPQGVDSSPYSVNTDGGYDDGQARAKTARMRAHREGRQYHKAEGETLWEPGVSLKAGKRYGGECWKHLIELNPPSLDYAIIMAFLDNHSGGIHGSGHAGILIIDGRTGQGTFTDFGPYRPVTVIDPKTKEKKIEELAKVRFGPSAGGLLLPDLKLDEEALGKLFVDINQESGSGIVSKKTCGFTGTILGVRLGAEGPEHPQMGENVAGFPINGQVAWAAFALHPGAYDRMLAYAKQQEAAMLALTPADPRGYKNASNNCMTYAIAVLDVGLGYPGDMKHGASGNADHPNDHISRYMKQAVEAGFFDHRMAVDLPEAHEATENDIQGMGLPGIRHHKSVPCVSYTDR